MLTLEPERVGGIVVTSPIDPARVTRADTVAEAFARTRDALAASAGSRADRGR